MNRYYGFNGFSIVNEISEIIGIVVLCIGAYFLVKLLINQYNLKSNKALNILDERYANGEISDSEYAEKKHLLLLIPTNKKTTEVNKMKVARTQNSSQTKNTEFNIDNVISK